MAIYDAKGNTLSVGGEVTSAEIKTALIGAIADGSVNMGAAIGATLTYTSPGPAWETNAETAYASLLAAYKAVPNSGIPFFISTDQHGSGVEQHRWLNNHDSDANGMGVMSLNLGDTVTDYFNAKQLTSLYQRTKQVKNYIGVYGNHDIMKGSTEIPNYYDLRRYFDATREQTFSTDQQGWFVVVDEAHSVKYVCVTSYTIDAAGAYGKGYTTAAVDWLIDELSKNDGYDIVYLQHWPMYKSRRARGETKETTSGTAQENASATSENYKMWQMLIARKNKTSGSYVDTEGVTHTFDFTGCEHELLCTLHGHDHAELMSTADGLTAYAANRYPVCVFGLVDRENRKLYIWQFDATAAYDVLEINI